MNALAMNEFNSYLPCSVLCGRKFETALTGHKLLLKYNGEVVCMRKECKHEQPKRLPERETLIHILK